MYENSRDVLIAVALKYQGKWNQMYKAISLREYPEKEYFDCIPLLKSKVLTLLDPEYPPFLKMVHHPPLVLFYYGDLNILNDYYKNVSIVGSRSCTEYGIEITEEITKGLVNKGFVIVSGLASGIDAVAHRSCIESGGKTVAILGSGIDVCFPSENKDIYNIIKKEHLLISEYPGLSIPEGSNFPIRNRIIAGLSKTVVVTEASPLSGSLITAGLALSINADVMCVPHIAGINSGCNRLIKSGAFLVESADDVISQMSKF